MTSSLKKPTLTIILFLLICGACKEKDIRKKHNVDLSPKHPPAVKTKLIRIGSIQQLSGKMAKYGKTHVAAVKAQLEIVNSRRKKEGYPRLDLIVEDDQLMPAKGGQCIEKADLNPKCTRCFRCTK